MAKRNEKFLKGIQVQVACLLIQDGAQKCFRGHVEAFYRMVVAYNKEIDKNRNKEEKDVNYQKVLNNYRRCFRRWEKKKMDGSPPPEIPKPKWAKENSVICEYSNFCEIAAVITKKFTSHHAYVPPANKRKANPIEWISNSPSDSRIPTPDEELMCKYVLLAIIHDEIKLLKGETPSSEFVYFNQKDQLKSDWFDFEQWGAAFYQESLSRYDDYNSKIELALQYVDNDLDEKPTEKGQETSDKEHSLPLFTKQWAYIFGVSPNKMRELREGKQYHFRQVSPRKWTLPKGELPTEYLEKFRNVIHKNQQQKQ